MRDWQSDLPLGPVQAIAQIVPDIIELDRLIKPFKSEPGMSWANPEGTIWITCSCKGNAVGICAIGPMGLDARMKSDVVLPLYRGHGVYSWMSTMRLELAVARGFKTASAFAGPMSINQFLKNGFVPKGPPNKHGITYVHRALT